MRPGPAFLSALLILIFAGCATTATPPGASSRPPAPREPAWVSLERTPNGAGAAVGPVYIVTLFEDGKVIYEGHAAVKRKGTFSRTIPREHAAEIFSTIETINLWERPRRYDVERIERGGDSVIVRRASDEVPWDILRARSHGRMIRIDGLFFAPHDILALKQLIERRVDLAAWLGEPAGESK